MEQVATDVPVLSRGKHRNPRKGACFMEYASFLAGEPWSDHPACTHPLLAAIARHVNDCTSDAGRARLAPLIPSVIGLTPDDPRMAARLTLGCVRTALPVVSDERSEEHTSELQSRGQLVCRRLLEKKKEQSGHMGEPIAVDDSGRGMA